MEGMNEFQWAVDRLSTPLEKERN